MDLRSIYTVILRYHNTSVFSNQCPRTLEDGEQSTTLFGEQLTTLFLSLYFILMSTYFKINMYVFWIICMPTL